MIKTAIIMAMHDEALPLIEALQLKKITSSDPYLPFETYTSKDEMIIVSVNGKDPFYQVDCVATQPAAMNTMMTIKTYEPSLIISAGTAGAFKKHGASIGDIYLSRSTSFHDRRIAIPGFDTYGNCCIETSFSQQIADKTGFKLANISSGNSLDMPEHDYHQIEKNRGEVKDMEAASVAWVSQLYRTKMIAVKSITDLMDTGRPTAEEFLENLHVSSKKLTDAMLIIIEMLRHIKN